MIPPLSEQISINHPPLANQDATQTLELHWCPFGLPYNRRADSSVSSFGRYGYGYTPGVYEMRSDSSKFRNAS
jgi:hypothetical protein